jgi:hypothetical protein
MYRGQGTSKLQFLIKNRKEKNFSRTFFSSKPRICIRIYFVQPPFDSRIIPTMSFRANSGGEYSWQPYDPSYSGESCRVGLPGPLCVIRGIHAQPSLGWTRQQPDVTSLIKYGRGAYLSQIPCNQAFFKFAAFMRSQVLGGHSNSRM